MKAASLANAACLLFLMSGLSESVAEGLENGDFTRGKLKWRGDGEVVYLQPDGTITESETAKSSGQGAAPAQNAGDDKPGPSQIIKLALRNTQFTQLSQEFVTSKGTAGVDVEVVFKASNDFKLNEKARTFSKSITWGPGSTYYWSGEVYPKVDLFFRLDKPKGGYCYKMFSVKPGSDWEKIRFHWDNVLENEKVTLSIFGTPGQGTLWIKSVAVSP